MLFLWYQMGVFVLCLISWVIILWKEWFTTTRDDIFAWCYAIHREPSGTDCSLFYHTSLQKDDMYSKHLSTQYTMDYYTLLYYKKHISIRYKYSFLTAPFCWATGTNSWPADWCWAGTDPNSATWWSWKGEKLQREQFPRFFNKIAVIKECLVFLRMQKTIKERSIMQQ